MKKLFVTLILVMFATVSYAGTIAYIENNSGGKIRLTDETCKRNPKYLYALATSSAGNYIEGCWNLVDGVVVIDYGGEDKIRVYDGANWIFTPYGETKIKLQKKEKLKEDYM